jgi:hydroxyethylthiazole kinase-like sugar kinase family protein
MYTDGSGDTTWEPIDLDDKADWMAGVDAKSIRFGVRPPNVTQDWHPAPQRQFVVILSGALQITFPDNSTKVFVAGDARLMDNITGKGHQTMAVGDEPCITATVALVDQTPR